jgi:Amt family ammonium transporter
MAILKRAGVLGLIVAASAALLSSPALAAEDVLNSGNTAWILTATALVLLMTMPGLALFYGGLVASKNFLSVLMHVFAICCSVSVLWLVFVYSLAFGDGGSLNPVIGGFDKIFLSGAGLDGMVGDIPETVFFMFQMTFAIITPALIVGAYPERMKFSAVLLFSVLWVIIVYSPVAHWVWGGGWLNELGVMDFAGGLVVHTTAGVSALVVATMLGRRRGHPQHDRPAHNPGLTMAGAAMLWVGWFGFNAGSALAADANAGMALLATHVAAATAALTWMFVQWFHQGKPTLVGIATGTIAGLATVTPAAGYIGPIGALVIGFAAGVICYIMAHFIQRVLKLDDSLDVFAVHGVGGMLGILLTSFFAATVLDGLGLPGSMGHQLWIQAVGVGATAIWSGLFTYLILIFVRAVLGLRVSEDEEATGLDITHHGERGYDL